MASSSQSNGDQIAAFLASKGLPTDEVAALEGNFEVESHFDPTAYNAGEGAIGIAQWERGRRQALDAFAAKRGTSETDLATQEAFLWKELTGPYAGVLAQLRKLNDPGQEAAIVDAQFEGSAGTTRQSRIDDARAIYAQLAGGQSIPGASNPGGGTSLPSGGSGTGAAGFASGFPGGGLDPLNWPGELAGKAAGGLLKVLLPFITKATFLMGGLALVVVGLHRASEPAREHAESAAAEAAPLAALA